MRIPASVRQVPAWLWVALVVVAGAVFLVWHRYVNNHADTDWHNPMEVAPAPTNVLPPFVPVPGVYGCRTPMLTSGAMRGRAYPGVLADVCVSLGGD